jgi:Lrp/AsnC family leucine-responsive transcriptional regulator
MIETSSFDRLDRDILRRLQINGRETCEVIGEHIGLSGSAVQRRIRRLEEIGAINRYVALLRPEALGLGLTAYVSVLLEKRAAAGMRNPLDEFRASVLGWPEVVECVGLTGEMDFMMRLVVADMAAYSRFMTDTLLRHPAVRDCKTSIVVERVKSTTALPI